MMPDVNFLFLLVAEGLSKMITSSKREGSIKEIKKGKSLSLSHMLFVDDIILFGLGTQREARKVQGNPIHYNKITWNKYLMVLERKKNYNASTSLYPCSF